MSHHYLTIRSALATVTTAAAALPWFYSTPSLPLSTSPITTSADVAAGAAPLPRRLAKTATAAQDVTATHIICGH